ncbi:DNA adenine methylase [Curvibacter sp. HBC61]|uniref:DNA adenine methylase n=1 Tax=Curvibacter cyanobacteriorum TaxID=3026422 RepID=A0ABT5MWX2_9BURK|nr:DNA adenine methylase [Curvibacter sp. HBC61]MDD0838400.1 DNA adenine methylase [Curvibacter sp. HBC61]
MLDTLVPQKTGFYDLFCGSASVAGHVAQKYSIPVFAGDLQKYAVVMAASQVEQVGAFDAAAVWCQWINRRNVWLLGKLDQLAPPPQLPGLDEELGKWRVAVEQSRAYCAQLPECFPIARAYGGYYFSPAQALAIDALRSSLPDKHDTPALAALIDAASSCSASPGHTAQPFSTKDSALPHLAAAWNRDVSDNTNVTLQRLALCKAKVKGQAYQKDALALTEFLTERDLAFVDPPYSEVQYSRFYHVLEAIALGTVGPVTGIGRYPDLSERPQSLFSLITQSAEAFDALMLSIAAVGAEAIVTFPSGDASNGLSGELVEAISDQYFNVKTKKIASLFSTLGGNAVTRTARKSATELVLHLAPK